MEDVKIINVFNDDKFINPAIKLFENVVPNISKYFVLKSDNSPVKFCNYEKLIRIDYFKEVEKDNFIELISSQNAIVFFHSLEDYKIDIALNIPESIKKVWFIWGYDLYGWYPFRYKKFERETTKLLGLQSKFKHTVFSFIWLNKVIFPAFIVNKIKSHFTTPFYKAVQKMNYVVPVVPTEYKLAKKINKNLVYLPFTYGFLEDLVSSEVLNNTTKSTVQNILLGNSADPSNNHVELFIKLSKLNLGTKKVYVPLSYSGNEKYIKTILQKGQEILGDNFYPLTNFLSLEEYNAILNSCTTLLFNHTRQQGVGNIIAMLYYGKKVYLNEKSTVFKYYKSLGVKLFSSNQVNQESLNIQLSKTDIEKNKNLMFKYYGKIAVEEKVREMMKTLNV